jgi:hypothetical protein
MRIDTSFVLRHHLHLRVQSEEKASPLAALWEKVRRLAICLKTFSTVLLRIASFPASTGNVNLIIMSYDFGAQRVATFALLTFTALLASRSCGIVIAKFSGHAVALRSSPTVFGNGWTPASASTGILSGKPPRVTWSAAMLLGL